MSSGQPPLKHPRKKNHNINFPTRKGKGASDGFVSRIDLGSHQDLLAVESGEEGVSVGPVACCWHSKSQWSADHSMGTRKEEGNVGSLCLEAFQ